MQPVFFINSSDGAIPNDVSTRKRIRQLAMRKVANARRQQGRNTRINVGQYPVDVLDVELNATHLLKERPQHGSSRNEFNRSSTLENKAWDTQIWAMTTVPRSMSCTGYELMRIQYKFDVFDLSALTSFYIGRSAAQFLCTEPSRLVEVLKCKQWSFLDYVPALYGRSKCLDDAIHCVATRLRYFGVTAAGTIPNDVLDCYTVALRSLQLSLDNSKCRLEPDVLCATEILGIFEVIPSCFKFP